MFHLNLMFLGTFVLALRLFIPIQSSFNYYFDYFESKLNDATVADDEVDFIVVGSGSAGSAIAAALSRHNKVLLLEAGGDPLTGQSVPGFANEFFHTPHTDWMYQTVPQKNSHFGHTLKNISKWPRGIGLGGTSNLHFTIYSRSHPLDYDNWAQITRDDGWRYEHLLKYFKKSLNYHGKFKENEKHYGNGDRQNYDHNLNVENKPPELEPLLPFALEAGLEIGIEDVNDLNGPQRTGFGSVEYTQKDGARCGAFQAFIKPFLYRKNLIISRYSMAVKIELDAKNRATGVWFRRHGQLKFAKARKEIIISAGAIESPKLLLLSGIGPKKDLEDLNIIPRVNLPVGQNLVDHFSIYLPPIVLEANPTGKPLSIFVDKDFNMGAFYNYFVHGKGPLTQPSSNNWAGFLTLPMKNNVTTTQKDEKMNWPNFQIVAVNIGATPLVVKNIPLALGWRPEESHPMWENVVGKSVLFLGAVLARPKSKGSIKLMDGDPTSRPLIDPNYLDDQQDLDILGKGVQLLVKLVHETKAFQKLGAKMSSRPIPSCGHHKIFSHKYWQCYIRHLGTSGFHPAGSCRMGRDHGDPSAVVDSMLRVLHTKGLRVSDASIMPEIVNGNPNSAIFMIGEKTADMIRDHWSQQYLVCPRRQGLAGWVEEDAQKCFYSQIV